MKKLIISISILCFSIVSFGQLELTTDPFSTIGGKYSLGVDYCLSENFSVELNAGYRLRKRSNILLDYEYENKGIELNALAKYYFSPQRTAEGFYTGMFFRFIDRSTSYTDLFDVQQTSESINFSRTKIGVGGLLGFKIVTEKGFICDINLGVGRAFVNDLTYDSNREDVLDALEIIDFFNTSMILIGEVGIGYRFGNAEKLN
jgi:hypothetical protein